MSNTKVFKEEDVARLKQIVREGTQIQQEIEDLKAGLSDTIKAIAEEMDLKHTNISKAIKAAHKLKLAEMREDMDEIEEILDICGMKNL